MTVETQNANENNLWMLYAAYQLQRHYDPQKEMEFFFWVVSFPHLLYIHLICTKQQLSCENHASTKR